MRQKGLTTNLSLFFAQIVFNIVEMRRDGMRGKLENCFCLKSEKQPEAELVAAKSLTKIRLQHQLREREESATNCWYKSPAAKYS